MKNDFSHWKKQHERQQLGDFSTDYVGQLWLKTKSIVRKDLLPEFINKYQIALRSSGIAKQFEELFSLLQANPKRSHAWLDEYIKDKNKELFLLLTARSSFPNYTSSKPLNGVVIIKILWISIWCLGM